MTKLNLSKGFTLIELLVVISIIGTLSSIVIASLSTARDRGRVGGGLKFATHNYHAFGADASGQWNFDEPSGDAKDLSGNNRNLSASSGSLVRNANTPTGEGTSLVITADGNYATTNTIPLAQQSTLSDATISAWIYPTSPPSGSEVIGAIVAASKDSESHNPLLMYAYALPGYNGLGIGCRSSIMGDPGFGETYFVFAGAPINKWSHFACTINTNSSPKKFYGYADGRLITSITNASYAPQLVDTLSVGGASQAGLPPQYNALIDDAAVYTQTLAESDIQRLYAEGALKHGIAILPE